MRARRPAAGVATVLTLAAVEPAHPVRVGRDGTREARRPRYEGCGRVAASLQQHAPQGSARTRHCSKTGVSPASIWACYAPAGRRGRVVYMLVCCTRVRAAACEPHMRRGMPDPRGSGNATRAQGAFRELGVSSARHAKRVEAHLAARQLPMQLR